MAEDQEYWERILHDAGLGMERGRSNISYSSDLDPKDGFDYSLRWKPIRNKPSAASLKAGREAAKRRYNKRKASNRCLLCGDDRQGSLTGCCPKCKENGRIYSKSYRNNHLEESREKSRQRSVRWHKKKKAAIHTDPL